MKTHSTNYKNAFIEVAEDCPALQAEIPPVKGDMKTVANLQFDMLSKHPYKYTSDDVIFAVFAQKNELTKEELTEARIRFFSKGQPCMRTSPLTKRYGWGVHNNEEGKMAIFPRESDEYKKFAADKKMDVVKAMKSKR